MHPESISQGGIQRAVFRGRISKTMCQMVFERLVQRVQVNGAERMSVVSLSGFVRSTTWFDFLFGDSVSFG